VVGRPAPRGGRRRPARARLGIEALEVRDVPTVFAGVDAAGVLEVRTDRPDNSTDIVTIDHRITQSGPVTLVSDGVNQTPFPDFQFTSIQIHGGFGLVEILGTFKPLTADANDEVIVGTTALDSFGFVIPGSGNMQNIMAPLFFTNDQRVWLDDSNDPTGQNVTLNVVNEVAQVTHMAPAPININVFGAQIFGRNDLIDLRLYGGRAHNTFDVLDTPVAFRFGFTETQTNLFTGPSNDTVNVRGTHSAPLNIIGRSRELVTIGNNGNLDNIQGAVNLSNPPQFSALIVDGSAASSAQNVTMSVANGFGTIHGLAPADITYKVSDVSEVIVHGSTHRNTWTVQDTFRNPSFADTLIETGSGGDTVNVLGTTGKLEVFGEGGFDTVNIGGDPSSAGTLTRIQGEVAVFNFGGARTKLNVNNSGDRSGRFITLTATQFQGEVAESGVTGKIHYDPSAISALHVFGDQGNDQFFVLSTGGGPAQIFLHGGSGSDFFSIGSPFNNLDTILNVVNVIGGVGGFNTLFVQDQGAPLGHSYVNRSGFIERFGDGGPLVIITFNNHLQSVRLFENGSPGPQAQDLALTERVQVGETATLTGTLVDDDPSQVLSLTVDWGDGSDPDTSTPDRDPFAVTHSYASPGRYFVHVTWSDSDGVSNSQDLLIRVRPARSGGYGPEAPDGGDGSDGADAVFALLGSEAEHDRNP
jgi:hypothetical protein